MTEEAQRVAIAEVCGWKIENYGPTGYETLYWRLRKPDGAIRFAQATGESWCRAVFPVMMPDYLHDLNAMHSAEKWLRGAPDQYHNDIQINKRWSEYEYQLKRRWGTFHLEATQRAEVFLRTLNLWVE